MYTNGCWCSSLATQLEVVTLHWSVCYWYNHDTYAMHCCSWWQQNAFPGRTHHSPDGDNDCHPEQAPSTQYPVLWSGVRQQRGTRPASAKSEKDKIEHRARRRHRARETLEPGRNEHSTRWEVEANGPRMVEQSQESKIWYTYALDHQNQRTYAGICHAGNGTNRESRTDDVEA